MRKKYGLLGQRLSHSHSPFIHSLYADYPYSLFEVQQGELEGFIRQDGIGGLNVTIPYKQTVMNMIDCVDERALRIGSVNTLLYGENGRITGHNTDYRGFEALVEQIKMDVVGKTCVVLGSGGTSRTAVCVLTDMGAAKTVVVSRNGSVGYGDPNAYKDAQLLVNTTPVGMYPDLESCPIDLNGFERLQGVIDVIYNPLKTRLILEAEKRGIPCTGGLLMLTEQARAAASLFTGEAIARERGMQVYQAAQKALFNLVLIGMPGSGKSCVGQALAGLLNRKLIDLDVESLAISGYKSIPDIFASEGEEGFRRYEHMAVQKFAGESGCVLVTGGGTPLFGANRGLLLQNGFIVYLDTPLDQLDTSGRPLSTDLQAMFKLRGPIYKAFADMRIANDRRHHSAFQVAEMIRDIYLK